MAQFFGFPAFKMLLLITNLAMIALLLSIMVQHYKSNNNLYSWSSVFHLLCFVWLCIRALFWWFTVTSTTIWDESYFELLYWMPNPLQFGSFLLFPLFFSQVLYRGKWKNVWTYVRPIYIIALACIVVFQLFWALLAFQVRCNLSLKQKIAKDR
jgi:glycopeptide antibiotics resistance protein